MSSNELRHEPQPTPEQLKEAPSLHIYIPGIMGTDQGMKAIYEEVEQAIQESYPGAQFEGKNSYISPDTLKLPDKDRYILLARKVVEALRDKRDIHLYGHSLGAVEVSKVLGLVKKMRPDLLREGHSDLDKLHIILMSPAGFGKDFLSSLRMVGRMKDIVQASSEASGHIYGLETVGYIPLKALGAQKNEGSFLSLDEQTKLLNSMLRDKSQRGAFGNSESAQRIDAVPPIPNPDVLAKRFDRLTDQEKQTLREIDDSLLFYARIGNHDYFQDYLRRRGKLLGKYAQQTYDGLPLDENASQPESDAETEKATWRLYAQALLGSASLIGGILRGNSYREIKPLYDAGVDVQFLVPEFDVLVKMSEINDFLGEEKTATNATMLDSATHSNSGFTPRMLGEAFRRISARRNNAVSNPS